MANYPVGLGNSRISILVTDDAEPQPVVMTIYTVHMTRESRPSLPMFGDHVTCSFVQVSQLCRHHDNSQTLWRSSCDRVLVQDQDPLPVQCRRVHNLDLVQVLKQSLETRVQRPAESRSTS